MSSAGQALGGIVGGVVGFFVGGPSGALYGYQIGSTVGTIIDPPKGPTINLPRLNDLRVQTSTYGAPIPRNYGTTGHSGNIFWLKGDRLTEVIQRSGGGKGGKGSPATTNTPLYYATFAVGLCKGPIAGVRRIWVGPDLYYDATTAPSAITPIISFIGRFKHAGKAFTVYSGSDTQAPDPLIQADRGVANVPAYRGLSYIVFDNLPLAKYQNSLVGAQVKVEIVSAGSFEPRAAIPIPIVASASSYAFDEATGLFFVNVRWRTVVAYSPTTLQEVFRFDTGVDVWSIFPGKPGTIWGWNNVSWYVFDARTGAQLGSVPLSGPAESNVLAGYNPYDNSFLGYNNGIVIRYQLDAFGLPGATGAVAVTLPTATWQGIVGTRFGAVAYSDLDKRIVVLDSAYEVILDYASAVGGSGTWANAATYDSKRDLAYITASDGSTIHAVNPDPAAPGVTPHTVSHTGSGFVWPTYMPDDDAIMISGTGGYPEFFIVDPDTMAVRVQFGGTAGYWAYSSPYHDGPLVAVPGIAGAALLFGNNGAVTVDVIQFGDYVVPGAEPLSTIVSAECLGSSLLAASDIDVTELSGDSVRGYSINATASIRGGLEPLRAVWPFDVVQAGYKIKFKKRGGAAVATIPASALDARSAGDKPGIRITDTREMDSVLPREVRVKYLDVVREYDVNEQSEERINTDAVNTQDTELAIVMNAGEAKQTAAMLLYLYWLERYDVSLTLGPEYLALEPGDVIDVAADNATYTLRLTSVNYLPDGRLECRAKYSSAALYVQRSVADEGQSLGPGMRVALQSQYVLLDIPLMRDADDAPGFPVAMSGFHDPDWPGGILFRSDDGGSTWTDISATLPPGATIGTASNTLSAHGGTVFDKSGTLSVTLSSGTLSSVTQAQLFTGQNWFAYGTHGRWEIVAAQKCVLQVDGSYLLSDFLRGQRGTEWATGLHAPYDYMVLLDSAQVGFVSVNAATLGSTRLYRGITLGLGLDSDVDRPFAYAGVNLECLSPVHLTGNRHPTTRDWTLTWVRRGRLDAWRDLIDLPLGEATESYDVEVYADGTYATVKRTFTALSTPTAAYTSAQQVADFGSNQATLYLKIYQNSATVGRGYPLIQSITR